MKLAHWGIKVGIVILLITFMLVATAFIAPIHLYTLILIVGFSVCSGLFFVLYGIHKTYNTNDYGIGKEIHEEEDKIEDFLSQRGYRPPR